MLDDAESGLRIAHTRCRALQPGIAGTRALGTRPGNDLRLRLSQKKSDAAIPAGLQMRCRGFNPTCIASTFIRDETVELSTAYMCCYTQFTAFQLLNVYADSNPSSRRHNSSSSFVFGPDRQTLPDRLCQSEY